LLSHIKSDAFPTSLYTWNGDALALPIGASYFGYVYEGVPHGHALHVHTRGTDSRAHHAGIGGSERARHQPGVSITTEVVALEKRGAKFEDIRHLVAGSRGKLALQNGKVDQGVI